MKYVAYKYLENEVIVVKKYHKAAEMRWFSCDVGQKKYAEYKSYTSI